MPESLDDVYEVLKAFKENDANGNGDPNDEIPLGHLMEYTASTFLNAFGFDTRSITYLLQADEDGKVYLGETTEAYKDFGRVALLGCTRIPTIVDFYHDVHFKGLTLVGAHTIARPKQESRPGFWTETDDCRAALQMLAGNRLNVRDMIHEIHFPLEAESVYNRLATDPDFPIGVLFDWTELNS